MTKFIKVNYKLIICFVLCAILVICFSIYGFATNKFAGSTTTPAAAQSETEPEEAIEPRTTQWMALNVPVKISDIIVKEDVSRAPSFNHISYDFEYLPGAIKANEFAILSNFAKSFLGVKYTAGGKNPGTGFDCSGFALYVLRHCGSEMLAASCQEQFKSCYEIPLGHEEPGDLVFFTGTGYDASSPVLSHVGIYLGDNLMIHAGTAGICIVNVTDPYWTQHFACFGRPTI